MHAGPLFEMNRTDEFIGTETGKIFLCPPRPCCRHDVADIVRDVSFVAPGLNSGPPGCNDGRCWLPLQPLEGLLPCSFIQASAAGDERLKKA